VRTREGVKEWAPIYVEEKLKLLGGGEEARLTGAGDNEVRDL
jgi:hypothetical protein